MRLATPPEAHTQQATSVEESNASSLLMMGFPSRVTDPKPSLCACHSRPTTGGYLCSRCSSKVCSLPTTCPACSLTLILSTHLARSYHHLFPLQNWKTVSWSRATSAAHSHKMLCFGCQTPFPSKPSPATKEVPKRKVPTIPAFSTARNAESASTEPSMTFGKRPEVDSTGHRGRNEDQTVSESGRYACGSCREFFCVDCDVFCHEIVHNCPGCLSREGDVVTRGEEQGQNGVASDVMEGVMISNGNKG